MNNVRVNETASQEVYLSLSEALADRSIHLGRGELLVVPDASVERSILSDKGLDLRGQGADLRAEERVWNLHGHAP